MPLRKPMYRDARGDYKAMITQVSYDSKNLCGPRKKSERRKEKESGMDD